MNFLLLLKLYSPLFLFLVFLIFALFFTKKDGEPIVFKMEKYGFNFTIPISRLYAKKLMFILFSIASVSLYTIYDFTIFFPKQLEMKVFYDDEGIAKCVNSLSYLEKKDLKIISNDTEERNKYFCRIDSTLKTVIHQNFFTLTTGQIHSEGKTTFITARTDGIQKYVINESDGEVTHVLEVANQESLHFKSFFSKIESPNDLIDLSLKDIFLKGEILIKPQFKEILAENNRSTGYTFDHILYGVTKIYFYPYPKFSNTLYLLKVQDKGLVPIGYAVYRTRE